MSVAALIEYRAPSVSRLLEHASARYANSVVISMRADGSMRGMTYSSIHRRARRLASALTAIGVRSGDRVASIAHNHHRHVELFIAVTGLGAVLHPVDPQLDALQIERSVIAARARYACFEYDLAPASDAAQRLRGQVVGLISMSDDAVPLAQRPYFLDYERLLAEHDATRSWPAIDAEMIATLCSSSTGDAALRLQTHRALVRNVFAACALDGEVALGERDAILLAAPLSHQCCWSLVCAAAASGARLVLPGAARMPRDWLDLMQQESVTVVVGAPAWWTQLLDAAPTLACDVRSVLSLRRVVACGGMLHRAIGARLVRTFGAAAVRTWG